MSILLHTVPELLNVYKKISIEWGIAYNEILSQSGREIFCKKGCANCCMGNELYEEETKRKVFSISIFGLEASNIKRKYNSLSPTQKKYIYEKHKRSINSTGNYYFEKCVFLDENNHCIIYSARPFLCRITGLPARSTTLEYACKKYSDISLPVNYENNRNKPWVARWLAAIKDAEEELVKTNSFNKNLVYLPLSTFVDQIIG